MTDSDPDLEALKSFYGRVIRDSSPETLPQVFVLELSTCIDEIHLFFADDMKQYHHQVLGELQDEARVKPYLNSGFTGEQWPDDFEEIE